LQAVIDFCRENGAFNPSTMGTCPNVGLMAKAAEEYGSHNTTFECEAGTMRVVDAEGKVLMTHTVEAGDVWRLCRAKDGPIKNWVEMAVGRARASNTPAVFWLDADRAHDRELLKKVGVYLAACDTKGLEILTMKPEAACLYTLQRLAIGKDAISVTGNVLRDYNTDLFPILELGTSAKMLSIVPLMAGGGMFETGAGGSAPKHIQQVAKENHLRWDSLGEFLALACSLTHIGNLYNNEKAKLLGQTLDDATVKFLLERKGPEYKGKLHDNRGSHFYLALYWAQELAKTDPEFAGLAKQLADAEKEITNDLIVCQGAPADLGGYFLPDDAKASAVMRPSATFNKIIDSFWA
jgi:isocitrate dehydrogenase